MKRRPGQPKGVDHGSERRPFAWVTLASLVSTTRYCTVSWMRHGDQVSAFAHYRDLMGVDATFVGLAQGAIGGPLHMAGDARAFSARICLGRDAKTQYDSIDAAVALAVVSLEAAVVRAVAGAMEEVEHPWLVDGRAEYQERRRLRRLEKAGQP